MRNVLGRSALVVFIFLMYIDLATNDLWTTEWQWVWFTTLIVSALVFIFSSDE